MKSLLCLSILLSFSAFAGHYNKNQSGTLDCKVPVQNCLVLSSHQDQINNEVKIDVLYVRAKDSLFVQPTTSSLIKNDQDFNVSSIDGEIIMKLKTGETIALGKANLPEKMDLGQFYAVEWTLNDAVKVSTSIKKTKTITCTRTALALNEKTTWENTIYGLSFQEYNTTVVNMNSTEPKVISSTLSFCSPK